MPRAVAAAIWGGLAVLVIAPVVIALCSPFLVGRDAVYIGAGFAGICALCMMVLQPLLAGGYLPGLRAVSSKKIHKYLGSIVIILVFAHIFGLYLTSPPDALDALLLVSPTPFSVYGVMAMWALIATGLLVAFRRKLRLRYSVWAALHNVLAGIVVVGTIVHAVQIDGTMGLVSKWVICLCLAAATAGAILHLRVIKKRR